MTPTNTEALRLADAIECSEPFTLIDKACNEAAAELRRLAAVEAERDKFASESAQHFIRGREWAERAGQMEAERDVLLKEKHTLTHQVICCGVAATHPDPLLTTRGAYAGRWNSNQAESVRQLRAERDALRAEQAQPMFPKCASGTSEQAAQAVPADLRSAAERTRQDLGPTGSNYPDVRVLLAFVEQALAAPTPPAPEAQRREPLTDEQIAEGRYRTWAAEPDDAPEAWSFLRGARWAESALAVRWGVKLGATTGQEPGND